MSNILEQLEKYVDKIVFAVIGLACLALLWLFVISNPYAAEYNGKKLGPGQFDKKVRSDAERLEKMMLEDPVIPAVPPGKVSQYTDKLTASIEIENDYAPLPSVGEIATLDDRSYSKPEMPNIEDVAAEWYRTVAHVPTDIVGPSNTYKTVETEYGDIDVVTVQGIFDMQKLISNFVESFNPSIGSMLAKYRSAQLAAPLFASIELQRQELTDDGWAQWDTVPHTKINPYTEIFESIPADITQLEIGGIDLLMVNYNTSEIQRMILQPECYEFASNLDTWYPPALHVEYAKLTKMERDKEREESRRTERGRPSRTSRRAQDAAMDMMGGDMMGPGGDARSRSRRDPRAAVRRGPRTLRDVDIDYDKLRLKENTQLDTYKQDMVIWAHDDTVVPEGTYRYRMRLGVFNPTAGRGWFDGKDKDYANAVVLWTEYTDVTESIEIDPMIYFFPLDLAKNKESVSIQVSKFSRGNWKTHQFDVLPGQAIGYEIAEEKETDKIDDGMGMGMMDDDFGMGYATPKEPDVTDYATGAILIDVVSIADWAGSSLRPREYFDVLYSLDGSDISRLPTKRGNWPRQMQTRFDHIRYVQDIEVELTSRGIGTRNKYQDQMQDMMMMPGMMMGN